MVNHKDELSTYLALALGAYNPKLTKVQILEFLCDYEKNYEGKTILR